MKIQIFGQNELVEHVNSGGKVYSHLISIGNPSTLFGEKTTEQYVPKIFKEKFKKILRLSFFDANEKAHLGGKTPKIIPQLSDIKKVINFYNSTNNEASGYTIHCWRGVSRSAAVALCILYLITRSEKKAKQILQQIRPQAMPLQRIVKLFDDLIGSKLLNSQKQIQMDYINKMKKELNFNPDDYIEELVPIDEI